MKAVQDTYDNGVQLLEEKLTDGSRVYSVKVTYINQYGMERDFECNAEDYTHATDLANELSRVTEIF